MKGEYKKRRYIIYSMKKGEEWSRTMYTKGREKRKN